MGLPAAAAGPAAAVSPADAAALPDPPPQTAAMLAEVRPLHPGCYATSAPAASLATALPPPPPHISPPMPPPQPASVFAVALWLRDVTGLASALESAAEYRLLHDWLASVRGPLLLARAARVFRASPAVAVPLLRLTEELVRNRAGLRLAFPPSDAAAYVVFRTGAAVLTMTAAGIMLDAQGHGSGGAQVPPPVRLKLVRLVLRGGARLLAGCGRGASAGVLALYGDRSAWDAWHATLQMTLFASQDLADTLGRPKLAAAAWDAIAALLCAPIAAPAGTVDPATVVADDGATPLHAATLRSRQAAARQAGAQVASTRRAAALPYATVWAVDAAAQAAAAASALPPAPTAFVLILVPAPSAAAAVLRLPPEHAARLVRLVQAGLVLAGGGGGGGSRLAHAAAHAVQAAAEGDGRTGAACASEAAAVAEGLAPLLELGACAAVDVPPGGVPAVCAGALAALLSLELEARCVAGGGGSGSGPVPCPSGARLTRSAAAAIVAAADATASLPVASTAVAGGPPPPWAVGASEADLAPCAAACGVWGDAWLADVLLTAAVGWHASASGAASGGVATRLPPAPAARLVMLGARLRPRVFARACVALAARLPPAPGCQEAAWLAAWQRLWRLGALAAAVPAPTALASPERDAFEAEFEDALRALGGVSDVAPA